MLGLTAAPAAAFDWIPPRSVTAVLPGATLAPSSTHVLQMVVRANGVPADLFWTASFSGEYPSDITPTSGFLSIGAGGVGTVDFTVTLSDTANGAGFLSVELTHQVGGGRAAKVVGSVLAAILGLPEVKPVPGSWIAPAGSSGSMSYQIHSVIGTPDLLDLAVSAVNPDPNNFGALFTVSAFDTSVTLAAGATITLSVPATIASNAYAGNLNEIRFTTNGEAGTSIGAAHAIVSASLPGSLPTSLVPVGVTPLDGPAAGRDGSVSLPARGYRLFTTGINGVRVMRDVSTDSIGLLDSDGNGVDDRVLGTVRIPAYAAALAVIPRFVTAAGETLDVGLLAAGRAGLMLLDLRTIEDPPFGAWEDFFDVDMNGIDDRILRTIPLSGFATDVGWFRTPSGRTVALVADADSGSVPVASTYNPAQVAAGTGQGIVAIDVGAALDFIGNPPFAAGAIATPGSALDLELRRGPSPDLAVADGTSGVAVYALTASSGVPATVTFTPRGSVALSSAWGTPYARDVAWVSNTEDSLYLAAAAAAGGVQIVRVPLPGAGSPSLVMTQQTAAPAIGIAGAWTGTIAAALGTGGVALLRAPGAAFLDRITGAAAAPYTAPVALARGAPWAATAAALEVASHQAPSNNATALLFKETTGPIPNLLVSDGPRLLVLRPGQAQITGVEVERTVPAARRVRLSVSPNPIERNAIFEVRSEGEPSGSTAGVRTAAAEPPLGPVRLEIFDVQGRLVRKIIARPEATPYVARISWDGRDEAGRPVASGRYWARATQVNQNGSAVAQTRSAVARFLVLR